MRDMDFKNCDEGMHLKYSDASACQYPGVNASADASSMMHAIRKLLQALLRLPSHR